MAAPVSIYTTAESLLDSGIPVSDWTVRRLNRLIAQVSQQVNDVTGQRFTAHEEVVYVDGDETSLLHRADLMRIQSLSEVVVVGSRTNRRGRAYWGPPSYLLELALDDSLGTEFTSDDYVVKFGRLIELPRSIFPGGAGNIKLTGVFGNVEPSSVKTFSTTTTSAVTPTSTSVTLTSVTGLDERDVLLIDGFPRIVTGVAGLTVSFEAPTGLLTRTIASGSAAKAYGAVHFSIERVVNFLCMREAIRQNQWSEGNFVEPSNLAGETTDGYSYKMFNPAQTVGFGRSPGMTGISEYDQILMDFTSEVTILFA